MQRAAQDLQDRMDDLAIEITATDGPDVRTSDDGWQHFRWTFRLTVRGVVLVNSGTYSAGMAHTGPMDPVDVFGSILMDCASVEPYANTDEDEERNVYPQTRSAWPDGWDEWAADLGMLDNDTGSRGDLRKFADDFREIMCRRDLLRGALGHGTYMGLLEIAQEL